MHTDDMDPARSPTIRAVKPEDGAAIWELVRDSKVLDLNSAYLYLLLCRDFGNTCVIAERNDQAIGFVTGYRPPDAADVIFLWQIGVADSVRGEGLGKRLIKAFLDAPGARGAHALETTVSPSNQASLALFNSIARDLGATMMQIDGFAADAFPTMTGVAHEAEDRYRISPLPLNRSSRIDV